MDQIFSIILIITGFAFLVGYFIIYSKTKPSDNIPKKRFNMLFIFGICSMYFLTMGVAALIETITRKEAYIESLKGKNPWKMEIRYELRGEEYFPVDTLFVFVENE